MAEYDDLVRREQPVIVVVDELIHYVSLREPNFQIGWLYLTCQVFLLTLAVRSLDLRALKQCSTIIFCPDKVQFIEWIVSRPDSRKQDARL